MFEDGVIFDDASCSFSRNASRKSYTEQSQVLGSFLTLVLGIPAGDRVVHFCY